MRRFTLAGSTLFSIGFLAGVVFLTNCGGGSGGVSAIAQAGALVARFHVDPDAGMSHPVAYPFVDRVLKSVRFDASDPHDAVLAIECQGTYREPGLTVRLEAAATPGGPAVSTSPLVLDGPKDSSDKPFALRLTPQGAWHGGTAPGLGASWFVRLRATNPTGSEVRALDAVVIRLLVLETTEAVDPSPQVAPDPNALDGDGDGFNFYEGDCDDSDPSVFPGAIEQPRNAVDDDCDGEIDEPPTGDSCAFPLPLRVDSVDLDNYTLDTNLFYDRFQIAQGGCGAPSALGAGAFDVVFSLDAGEYTPLPGFEVGLRITVVPTGFDATLTVYEDNTGGGAGGCDPNACVLLSNALGVGGSESVEILASQFPDFAPLIVVDGAGAADAGSFQITVVQFERPL